MLVTAEPADLARVVGPDPSTYVVLMNHNFLRDGDVLASLVGTDVAFVGMLGPAERAEQLVEYATKQGAQPQEADLAKFHGPVGLDIGADGPLEIAWSIMAQLMAAWRGRLGGPL